jgi:predicted ATPase
MLARLTLNNFKSFRQLKDLNIKPVTILCGANSCGKSSIMQSILLLKQTKESRNPNQSLLLNGKYVHLGDIENVIHGKGKGTSFKYEYEFTKKELFSSRKTIRERPPLHNILRYLLPSNDRIEKDAKYRLICEIGAKVAKEGRGYIKVADIDVFNVSVHVTEKNESRMVSSVEISHSGSDYKLKWKNISDPHQTRQSNPAFNATPNGEAKGLLIRFESLFPIIEYNEASDYEKIPYQVRNFLRAFDEFLSSFNEDVSYVGPLREEPSRRYIYENEVLEIGSKGENAAYIYHTEQEAILRGHYFFNEQNNHFNKNPEISLNDAMSVWLNQMNIKGFSPDRQSEIIRLSMEANSSAGTKVNIADVGFGVSQIFPILLEGLRMRLGGSLLLEQPEIHLHPALQMQMADYFLSLALSSKRVIVETHSEHIINRLVRRIVEDENNEISDLVAIYFVSNGPDGATYEEVKLDPSKGILNWPQGFFDQTASEQEKIIMAGIAKRKAMRGKEK